MDPHGYRRQNNQITGNSTCSSSNTSVHLSSSPGHNITRQDVSMDADQVISHPARHHRPPNMSEPCPQPQDVSMDATRVIDNPAQHGRHPTVAPGANSGSSNQTPSFSLNTPLRPQDVSLDGGGASNNSAPHVRLPQLSSNLSGRGLLDPIQIRSCPLIPPGADTTPQHGDSGDMNSSVPSAPLQQPQPVVDLNLQFILQTHYTGIQNALGAYMTQLPLQFQQTVTETASKAAKAVLADHLCHKPNSKTRKARDPQMPSGPSSSYGHQDSGESDSDDDKCKSPRKPPPVYLASIHTFIYRWVFNYLESL